MSQSQLYEWIKASEKLSTHYERVCCRIIGSNYFFTAHWDFSRKMYIKIDNSQHIEPETVEWLSPVSTDEKDLVASDNNNEGASVATLGSSFGIPIWLSEKPDFDKECVLVTATKYVRNNEPLHWDYSVWQIKKLDGETETGEYGWYYGLLNGDGEEWGPLEDLAADRYLILGEPNLSSTIPRTVGNNIELLITAYDEYIAILRKEIDGLIGLANVHGWKSSLVEAGKQGREKIATAKALLTSPASNIKKDIEVYVPVDVKDELPCDGSYSVLGIGYDYPISSILKDGDWLELDGNIFSDISAIVTHWLKKVTLSSLLTDNEK